MGQYQQQFLNLKGADLELAQCNSQASVPFALSSRGYGFLWNNPAIGRAVFGKNMTTFEAASTRVLDYWVVAADTPAEIVRAYAKVTGTVPEMPEYGLGFWQCKLRYQTQEELLSIAREHKVVRKLPLDVIVVDFFHWPKEGEWKFDPTFWPDPGEFLAFLSTSWPDIPRGSLILTFPLVTSRLGRGPRIITDSIASPLDAMIAELKSIGVEVMVSVWPTVDRVREL